MEASNSAVRLLVARLGPYRGPTHSGFVNFCHQRCGDTRFRLGIKFATGMVKCFHCGFEASVRDFLPGIPAIRRWPARYRTPRPSFRGENPDRLPWRPVRGHGSMTYLEERVVRYLEGRGILRERAYILGLGYGTEAPYTGCAIHPWLRDDGTLGGWQARRTYDPEDGSPKIIHALPSRWPRLYTPAQGGMLAYDLVPEGSPVMLVEGPYDTYSGLRVVPTVGLMGSEIYPAQIRRLQRKRPTEIIYGLDPDTFKRRWLPAERAYGPPKARENLKRLALAFDVTIRALAYPASFEGDLGGREDKSPHPWQEIAALVHDAPLYDPTL